MFAFGNATALLSVQFCQTLMSHGLALIHPEWKSIDSAIGMSASADIVASTEVTVGDLMMQDVTVTGVDGVDRRSQEMRPAASLVSRSSDVPSTQTSNLH